VTACVGWPGECAMYGDMHGCRLPDGHTGRHICHCATIAPPLRPERTRALKATCGTDAGYYRHRRTLGEAACEACREAHSIASAGWQARNRGAVNWGRAQSRDAA
jgi:hypothetical protein